MRERYAPRSIWCLHRRERPGHHRLKERWNSAVEIRVPLIVANVAVDRRRTDAHGSD